MSLKRSRIQGGFTLVELLVVIGVIAVLVAMLLPSLKAVRERANRIVCASNLRQTYLALTMYAQVYKEYPTLTTWDAMAASWGGEAIGDGQTVLPQLLVNRKYITAKAAQCTTTNDPRVYPYSFDEFSGAPWFRYNGPSVNGWWEWNYGHGANFGYYGWMWYTSNTPTLSGTGVTYRRPNYKKLGWNWYAHRAILCCPRMIQIDGLWTVTNAWEPHGKPPLSATTGWEVQSDNANPTKDRNYCFTDGHVEYIHSPS